MRVELQAVVRQAMRDAYDRSVVEQIVDSPDGHADRFSQAVIEAVEQAEAQLDLPSVHSAAAAADQPHAMINDAGDMFYPDGPEDAAEFNREHGARFVHPGFRWSVARLIDEQPLS
jgi:hypothetical protein